MRVIIFATTKCYRVIIYANDIVLWIRYTLLDDGEFNTIFKFMDDSDLSGMSQFNGNFFVMKKYSSLYIGCTKSRYRLFRLWGRYGLIWVRFLSLTRSKVRLCSANHRPSYWSNLTCGWLRTAWAYSESEQETENGPWSVTCGYMFCNYG